MSREVKHLKQMRILVMSHVDMLQDGPAFKEKKGSSSAAMGGFEHRLIEDFRMQQNIRQKRIHQQLEQQSVAAGAFPPTAMYPALGVGPRTLCSFGVSTLHSSFLYNALPDPELIATYDPSIRYLCLPCPDSGDCCKSTHSHVACF